MHPVHPRPWFPALALVAVLATGAAHPSAQADDPKAPFLVALGRFSVALDGTHGDEGPTIRTSLDEMERGLHQWDAQITAYEAAMTRELPAAAPPLAARMHLALGGVYLDRGRIDEAIRELSAAARLDETLADAHTLLGIAYRDARHDRAAAIDAFRRAVAAGQGSVARSYVLASTLTAAGQEPGAAEVRQRLLALPMPAPGAAAQAPFLRLGLVAEVGGLEPFFPPVRYSAGYATLLRGEISAALSQFRDAMAGDPLVIGAGAARGFVERAGFAMRDGRVGDALQQLDDGIQLEPELAEPRRLHGLAMAADGRYAEAVTELRAAVRLSPADERARLSLAQVLADSGQLDEAADALREAARDFPASGRARYMLARVEQRQGRYPEAIAGLQEATRFTPLLGANSIYDTIGTLEAARQNFAAAIDAYRTRAELDPNNPEGHQRLGDTYSRVGRDEEALTEFTVALLLDPKSVDAHAASAQVHLRRRDYARAAGAAQRALSLEPNHAEAHYVLGTALVRLGQVTEGRQELERFQRLQADLAARQSRRFEAAGFKREAAVAVAANEYTGAIALLRRAIALDPEDAEAHVNLGLALAAAGQPGEAIDAFVRAAALGASLDVHRHLAAAYAAAGRGDDSFRERRLYDELRQEALRRRETVP